MTGDVDRIVVEAGRRSGRAVIRGTRIVVGGILSMLAAGMTVEDVLADFPELERADVTAALAHAAALEGIGERPAGRPNPTSERWVTPALLALSKR